MRPLGLIGALAGALIAGVAGLASHMGGGDGGTPAHLLGNDPALDGVLANRAGGGHYYPAKPGERAHRRWRKARASGRHDFRKTLRKAA